MRRFDRSMCVSETDRLTFQRDYQLTNVSSIDTGVDVDYFSAHQGPRVPNRLLFTGSMDWMPNEDAILFFVREVLPRISEVIPDVSLAIVGRYPSRRLKNLCDSNPAILVTGRVEDVRPYLATSSVFIVPLRIGGGTRIKIFEAMASGLPVVSTSVGAEGLPLQHQRHLLLADSPDDFARSVVMLLKDRALARQITDTAHSLVTHNYDWRVITRQVENILRTTIQEGGYPHHEN
jgi:glycosyltransferase involved in cell wall biosynthesis